MTLIQAVLAALVAALLYGGAGGKVVTEAKAAAVIDVGKASWVDERYGDRYLALRAPRGTRVRICGEAACVERVSTDYGPSKKVHPDRVADLSRADFERVSGKPASAGICVVTVEYLDSPNHPEARPTGPPTDVGG